MKLVYRRATVGGELTLNEARELEKGVYQMEKIKIKPRKQILSDNVATQFSCPFCFNKLEEDHNFCCGEAGHGEVMYANASDWSWQTKEEFLVEYEVVDTLPLECGCEKRCRCNDEYRREDF